MPVGPGPPQRGGGYGGAQWYDWFPHDRFPPKYDTGALNSWIYILNNRARAELGIGGMFQLGPKGQIALAPGFENFVGSAFQTNLANIVLKVVGTAEGQVIDSMFLLSQALLLGDTQKHVERANKQLAAEMRKGLLQRYGQSVERRKQVPSYHRANRLSGNLRRAISQPDMAVGTATGISYINQDRLNTEARHWRRINFGVRGAAGAKGGAAQSKAPEEFTLLSSGRGQRNAGKVGFKSDPRPPMYLPAGFWEFIGGKAPGASQRLGRVGPHPDEASQERQQESRGDRLARSKARRDARLGNAAPSGSTSMTASQYLEIQNRQRGGQTHGGYYTQSLNRQSGVSSWGADYGGYPRTSTYRRETTGRDPDGGKVKRQRSVTRTVRGVRRSRQAFFPTRRNAKYPTRGVVASNFMDAGFRALAQNVDKVYFLMAQNIVNEAEDTVEKQALKTLMVKHNVTFSGLAGAWQGDGRQNMQIKRWGRGHGPQT